MTKRQQRGVHRIQLAALALGVVALASGGPVRADESKRRQLREEIERLLSDIASELRDVPGDSSTSDLDRTIDYAGRVSEKARDLKNQADDDSDARRMGESYPDIASRYKDAAGYLRELKNGHRKVDEWPRKCEQAVRELTSRMKTYTDSPDPRGVDEVPKLAREFGRVGKEAMEQAERTKNEMYTWYDRADDFSYSDGRWSDVRNNLVTSARTMYEHTVKQSEQVKRDDVCGNLAREERNPLVEDAMRKLYEGKKGIEMVYEQLDRQLGEMASSLDGLAGDSDASDIARADGKLNEIDRLLEQLDRVKGNDGEAKRRLEVWRNNVRAAREALKPLRVLKEAQFLADNAPKRCQEASQRLSDLVRRYVEKNDTKGIEHIKLQAKSLAQPIIAGLAKTNEQHATMERARSETQRFAPSEGQWSSLTGKYRTAAESTFEYWKKSREIAQRDCEKIAMGEDGPIAKAAIEQLQAALKGATADLAQLRSELRRWDDGIKELRRWYVEDTRNVRQLFCSIPESPGDYAEGDAHAAQLREIADRMRDRVRPQWGNINTSGLALIGHAERLMKAEDDDIREAATKARDSVKRRLSSLASLLNDELNGANDPEVRAQIEVGKQEHRRIQGDSSKCTRSELTYGNRRVDCIRVDGNVCYVVEIKPNNEDARKKGTGQIRDGIQEIVNALRGKKRRDELTGNLEVLRPCFDEAKETAKLEPELRVYEYCPPAGKLFKDFVVDLSE